LILIYGTTLWFFTFGYYNMDIVDLSTSDNIYLVLKRLLTGWGLFGRVVEMMEFVLGCFGLGLMRMPLKRIGKG